MHTERIWTWIAWRLPRPLVKWCAIRLMAHATTGPYSHQIVPELRAMDALQRWVTEHDNHELRSALLASAGSPAAGSDTRCGALPIGGEMSGAGSSRTLPIILLAVALALASACAKQPPNLPAADVLIWQANEVVVALGTAQHAAISLNAVQVCPTPTTCHPLLSTRNTGIVVDAVTDALQTIRAVPNGWLATANAALKQIADRLDPEGRSKLSAYMAAVRAVIAGV